MSEAERRKRLSYKERRKKWIFIQGVAIVVVALLVFASVFIYRQMNKEIYIGYQESSSVTYSVKIPKDAPFYSDYLDEFSQFADDNGDLWIPSNYAYPTTAATTIKVELDYRLNMGTPDVDYEYTYKIYAYPEIVDAQSKNKFPMPKTVIFETQTPLTQNSNNRLTIKKPIEIDYQYYNNLVKEFEDKLGIRNATENLIITMQVEVIGSSEVFESSSENTYVINVSVPLNENAFDVKYSTSSGQAGDCKILARKNAGNQKLYRVLAIVLICLDIALIITFVAFVYLTRNHDVNYSIKIRRLLNNYRSFIQRVVNGFDTSGYQLLKISSFKEMLAIRDTIQSPILMSENTDQTRSQFFIPTNTKILYVFEIKIDNYDELYGAHPEWVDDSLINFEGDKKVESAEAKEQNQLITDLYAEINKLRKEIEEAKEQNTANTEAAKEDPTEEATEEPLEQDQEDVQAQVEEVVLDELAGACDTAEETEQVLEDPTTDAPVVDVVVEDVVVEDAEQSEQALEEPSFEAETATQVTDEAPLDIDLDDNSLNIHCKRSFTANLMQSDVETVKTYYNELKNYILSFKAVKARMGWRYESFNRGRDQLFRIRIKGKGLSLYCALDPTTVDEARYFHEANTAKNYADVPTGVKIKSARGLKRALELVDAVMARFEIAPNPKAKKVDYLEAYPFHTTRELVELGYVKILSDSYQIVEPNQSK